MFADNIENKQKASDIYPSKPFSLSVKLSKPISPNSAASTSLIISFSIGEVYVKLSSQLSTNIRKACPCFDAEKEYAELY